MGREEIVTLRVGVRAKERKGEREGTGHDTLIDFLWFLNCKSVFFDLF